MRVFLLCMGVVGVLYLHTAEGSYGLRYPRQAEGTCLACAGEDCKSDKAETSKCEKMYTPAEGPEKALAEDLATQLGNPTADTLLSCFTLKFKSGDKEGELRDCGTKDVCKTIQDKATDLKIEVQKCNDCVKAPQPCNKDSGDVVTTTEAPPPPGPTETEETDPPVTQEPVSTTTVKNASSAVTFKQYGQGSSFYWLWMMAVAALFMMLV